MGERFSAEIQKSIGDYMDFLILWHEKPALRGLESKSRVSREIKGLDTVPLLLAVFLP